MLAKLAFLVIIGSVVSVTENIIVDEEILYDLEAQVRCSVYNLGDTLKQNTTNLDGAVQNIVNAVDNLKARAAQDFDYMQEQITAAGQKTGAFAQMLGSELATKLIPSKINVLGQLKTAEIHIQKAICYLRTKIQSPGLQSKLMLQSAISTLQMELDSISIPINILEYDLSSSLNGALALVIFFADKLSVVLDDDVYNKVQVRADLPAYISAFANYQNQLQSQVNKKQLILAKASSLDNKIVDSLLQLIENQIIAAVNQLPALRAKTDSILAAIQKHLAIKTSANEVD